MRLVKENVFALPQIQSSYTAILVSSQEYFRRVALGEGIDRAAADLHHFYFFCLLFQIENLHGIFHRVGEQAVDRELLRAHLTHLTEVIAWLGDSELGLAAVRVEIPDF